MTLLQYTMLISPNIFGHIACISVEYEVVFGFKYSQSIY